MRLGKRKSGNKIGLLLFTCAMMCIITIGNRSYAVTRNLNVESHTPEEIRTYIEEHTGLSECGITYAEEPVVTSPYSAGALSQATLQCALDALNEIRYIAGIYDDVSLSDTYNAKCQAGALVNYVNGTLSHYPTKPSDMSDELYQLGSSGAGSSNIAWHSSNNISLKSTVIHSWMADDDDGNIDRVGHRRWCLNPSMGQVGFGAVSGNWGTYSAMYSFDNVHSVDVSSTVVWPAQNMPTDYFSGNYPWSISSDAAFSADVSVVLTRVEDGKQWEFSNDGADGYFNYNADGYGQRHCLVFRPSDIGSYYDGDEFNVEVIENGEITLDYTVSFFDLEPVTEDVTLSMSAYSGNMDISTNGYYWGVAMVTISDSSISSEKLSVVSSDESIAQAMLIAEPNGQAALFIKGNADGVAKITVSLTKEITAVYTITVGNGGNHVHSYVETAVVNPTCTVKGTRTLTCEGCGGILTEDIAVIPHNYDTSYTVDKEATCVRAGSKSRHCKNCSAQTDVTKIPATDHISGGWVTDKEPTYSEEGGRHKECTVCHSVIESERIAKLKKQEELIAVGNNNYLVSGDSAQGKIVVYAGPQDKTVVTVTIPDTITVGATTYNVTRIAEGAFANCKQLKSVKVGKYVTEIEKKAFSGCSKLTKVTLSSKLTTIGANAFEKCTNLKSITIPASVKKIGSKAFYNCKNLKKITIKTKKLKSGTVGSKAFTGIHKKANVKVPKSKVSTYKNLLKKKGLPAKATVKK